MQDCKLCERISAGTYCQGCLNDWLKIRVVVQNHINKKYKPGEGEREADLKALDMIKQRDMKVFSMLWERDRPAFEKEISTWETLKTTE